MYIYIYVNMVPIEIRSCFSACLGILTRRAL